MSQASPTRIRASSEALSLLGELAAIYEILPRMKSTHNPVLKQSLAVAAGDLLGCPGKFYKVLTKELLEPGSDVEDILKQAERQSSCILARSAITDRRPITLNYVNPWLFYLVSAVRESRESRGRRARRRL